MTVTVIVGPPCAGKTTYARKHHRPGDVLVDYDAIADAFGSTTPWDPPPAVEKVTTAARKAAIKYLLRHPDSVGAQIIHSTPNADMVDEYADAGFRFHLIDPGMDECLERAKTDGRPGHFPAIIRAWYANPPALPDADDGEKGRPHMYTKASAAHIKAGPDDGLTDGTFTAYASVFGNVDSYGDVVMPGAFADTLTEWKASGNPIPLLFGHNMADPDYNIGAITDAVEDDHGLKITAALDLDAPKAAQVYRLLKGKRINQMSFAYDVLDAAEGTRQHDNSDPYSVFELRKLHLHEVSVVPIGANDQTEVLAVKTAHRLADRVRADGAAGRVIAPATIDELKAAHAAFGQTLATIDSAKASTDSPPDAASPDGGSREKASQTVPAARVDATIRILEQEN